MPFWRHKFKPLASNKTGNTTETKKKETSFEKIFTLSESNSTKWWCCSFYENINEKRWVSESKTQVIYSLYFFFVYSLKLENVPVDYVLETWYFHSFKNKKWLKQKYVSKYEKVFHALRQILLIPLFSEIYLRRIENDEFSIKCF